MNGLRHRAGLLAGLALLGAAAAGIAPAAAAGSGLDAFESCEQLVDYARAHVPKPVPYDPSRPELVVPAMPMPAATAPDGAARSEGAGGDFSSTNVQEAGVDEPDIVKTDGRRIFAIADGRFVEVDARAAEPRVLGSLKLDGGEHQLLLVGDRALVIGTTWDQQARMSLSMAMQPNRTVLTELDVSEPGRARIVRTLRLDGQLRAARLSDGVVRLVTSSFPRALGTPSAAATVAGWVPSYRLRNRRTGRVATRPVSSCAQVGRPQEFAGLGLLTVLTIDLARGLAPVDSDSLLSDVGTVYGSRGALYVAGRAQPDPAAPAGEPAPWPDATLIHQFAAAPGAQTHHRASGSVAGTLLSQWSMSEHAGVLRVASTVSPAFQGGVGPDVATAPAQSESVVTTLTERDGRLVQLGSVGGLGRDERIYAVRFIGDVGYVVTFRQVDPLYTLDLSDPRRPAVLGELKIPGYSAYLHPVGEDLLLGVGQDATAEGRRIGGQISLFDVADLRAPKRLATLPLPGWSSEVEWDHHAFLYWARSRLALVPSGFGPAGETPGALGVRITRADGLRRAGDVRHPANADGLPAAGVRRSLVIGGRLFTLSAAGLLSSDLATLAGERWLPFPATP